MRKIGIITYHGEPNLSEDDSLLIQPLLGKGFQAQPVLWDSKTDWRQFDAIVIRSCWDYHLRAEEFLNWLDLLDELGIAVWNPTNILRWNHRKSYLNELALHGIDVIETIWIEKNSHLDIGGILEENNWEKAVIKPPIGASAHSVFLVDRTNASELHKQINEALQKSDLMIQPFIKEIQTEGELSIMFIGGEYSHSVVKSPKENDFRSNYFGNSVKLAEPSEEIILQAKKVYDTIKSPLLFARIDGINVNGKLKLMEFELIEPYLFFGLFPQAAEKFANALGRLM
jgi:glutathione synthase/RimK-type ligase-like ATP-grasp enzyme